MIISVVVVILSRVVILSQVGWSLYLGGWMEVICLVVLLSKLLTRGANQGMRSYLAVC
jgi:hypothetical protein